MSEPRAVKTEFPDFDEKTQPEQERQLPDLPEGARGDVAGTSIQIGPLAPAPYEESESEDNGLLMDTAATSLAICCKHNAPQTMLEAIMDKSTEAARRAAASRQTRTPQEPPKPKKNLERKKAQYGAKGRKATKPNRVPQPVPVEESEDMNREPSPPRAELAKLLTIKDDDDSEEFK